MTHILSIGTELPKYKHNQADIAEFMLKLYPDEMQKKIQRFYKHSGIDNRYSILPDYTNINQRDFYSDSPDLEPFPQIEKRMEFYKKNVLQISSKAANKVLENINKEQVTHLITVSCTGLYAPGLDIDLVEALALNTNIYRTSVNFMGCYAAFHALKQADYICQADKKAVVLVVCTELCTLHFMKDLDMNAVTSNALFADGSAAVLLSSNKELINKTSIKIKGFYSKLLLSGKNEMAWDINSTAFKMILTEAVPEILRNNIKELISDALKHYELSLKDITHWAIHPGGRKILDYIEFMLELTNNELASSYKVLKNYGNMSSPTILFVLKDLLETNLEKPLNIFSAAFGPGLTIETMNLSNS